MQLVGLRLSSYIIRMLWEVSAFWLCVRVSGVGFRVLLHP